MSILMKGIITIAQLVELEDLAGSNDFTRMTQRDHKGMVKDSSIEITEVQLVSVGEKKMLEVDVKIEDDNFYHSAPKSPREAASAVANIMIPPRK